MLEQLDSADDADPPGSPKDISIDWEDNDEEETAIQDNLPENPSVASGQWTVRMTVDLPIQELIRPRKTNTWGIFKEGSMNKRNLQMSQGRLRVNSLKGSASPGVESPGGFVIYATPKKFPCSGAKLSFNVFFPKGFQFKEGGKLGFGFFIGTPGASRGNHPKAGSASLRLMWRKNGGAEAYIYRLSGVKQNPSYKKIPGIVLNDTYGDSLFRNQASFTVGDWNSVTSEIRQNAVDIKGYPNAEGRVALVLNGKTTAYDKMVWRDDPKRLIGGVLGSSFFGGSNRSYATPVDTYVLHRNITLT
ncbi:hypothetical protein HDV00_011584 [Rhizophlyctis rosea]|nr:hypothetical protein HDV00_011584 [Rhizophlyctis rosea]